VKEELRDMLLDRHISQFSMVPVKRNYAFEREDMRKHSQYVLKIRLPATLAMLPSDLSGRKFTCLFGTQTSPLEAVLLKRKIMGPSWIFIKR
jgi:DNA polymerase alpha subunit A